jgi:hypothetical protein
MNEASDVTCSAFTPSCSHDDFFDFVFQCHDRISCFVFCLHHHAAAHLDHLPGDIGRVIPRQERHRSGYVFRTYRNGPAE